MALDAIVLLDYLEWTEKRSIHVVGISLGGMIAQGGRPAISPMSLGIYVRPPELATRIPERIVSLTLAVTTPGGPVWTNFPPVRLLPISFLPILTPSSGKGSLPWLGKPMFPEVADLY